MMFVSENKIDLGDGLCLKQVAMVDAPAIYEAIRDDAEWLGRWLPFVQSTVEGGLPVTEAYVASVTSAPGTERHLVFTIVKDGEFAGLIGLLNVDWDNGKAEIGYWLRRRFTGQGLVTRSVRIILERAFGGLGLNRIVLRTDPVNEKSRAIAHRFGFTLEGIEREAERFLDGHYVDAAVFSLLAREWLNLKRPSEKNGEMNLKFLSFSL